ncbi:MAG: hypothetical protein ACI84R_003639, partial [Candidatus Azotimanducaceae bacterium]
RCFDGDFGCWFVPSILCLIFCLRFYADRSLHPSQIGANN